MARPDAWCLECERALVALDGASSDQWFRDAQFKIFCNCPGPFFQMVRRASVNFSGSCMRVLRIFHPCFLLVESTDRMIAKSSALVLTRNPPEIFCRSFIMRASPSA